MCVYIISLPAIFFVFRLACIIIIFFNYALKYFLYFKIVFKKYAPEAKPFFFAYNINIQIKFLKTYKFNYVNVLAIISILYPSSRNFMLKKCKQVVNLEVTS